MYKKTQKQKELHQLILDVHNKTKTVNYIVVGDSIRSTSVANNTHNYYKQMFAKLGVEVIFSAADSMTSHIWVNNTSPVTSARLSYVESVVLGYQGENSIIEFSLGVNDWSALGVMALKEQLKKVVLTLISKAPKATIVLCCPTVSGTIQRGVDLNAAYRMMAEELNLYMVDGYEATIHSFPRSGTNCMYSDPSHVNNFGISRWVNYLINDITPPELKWKITYPEYSGFVPEPAITNLAVIETGMYNDLGADLTGANWRRLNVIGVSPRTLLRLKHKGTRRDVLWKYGLGTTWFRQNLPTFIGSQDSWLIEVPDYATQLKVNLESVSGSDYDLLVDTPELYNVFNATNYVMSQEKINQGLF